VKPDVVFFGESLPAVFTRRVIHDFPQCDCLIVMGTSLKVQPFASLIDRAPKSSMRLLINREEAGASAPSLPFLGGFDFKSQSRDIFLQDDCDAGVVKLARMLGWEDELNALISAGPVQPAPLSTSDAN